MGKVLSAQELSALLNSDSTPEPNAQVDAALMEAIVIPTAEDLLLLTQAAIGDVQGVLPMDPEQADALRAALRRRLMGALAPEGEAS